VDLTFVTFDASLFVLKNKETHWKKGKSKMSIDQTGLSSKVTGCDISVSIANGDPLLELANMINWTALHQLILPDLKKTHAGCWKVGRKLQLRTHLGAMILQSMHNETDRSAEQRLKFDVRWQLFCGKTVVSNWKAPDHTKIEEFRNRFSPQIHHSIGEFVLSIAKESGFTHPKWMDVDSTVQEANITYPSDANLMVKVVKKAAIAAEGLSKIGTLISIDVKSVMSKAKEYFFLGKTKAIEIKQKVFTQLHTKVVNEVVSLVKSAMEITKEQKLSLSKKASAALELILEKGIGLLEDIRIFIATNSKVPTKILSLHANEVACISKGKLGKPFEFGRVFQLGRVPGNFLIIGKSKTIRESDKSAVGPMIYAHSRIFGAKKLESIGGDKSYNSQKNIRAAKIARVTECGIQQPGNVKNGKLKLSAENKILLSNRRAGIEPLIGHCKHGGLRRSRMKSDQTTESSAYRSVMGLNLRQLNRHIVCKYA
jgi:transposase, IS5 family